MHQQRDRRPVQPGVPPEHCPPHRAEHGRETDYPRQADSIHQKNEIVINILLGVFFIHTFQGLYDLI